MMFNGPGAEPLAQYNPWKSESAYISGFNMQNPIYQKQAQDNTQIYRTLMHFNNYGGQQQASPSTVFRTY